MRIDRISFSKTFPTGPYMNEKIGVEIQVEEGDDIHQVMYCARLNVDEWFKKYNPHLFEKSDAPIESELPKVNGGIAQANPRGNHFGLDKSAAIPVINREIERMQILIDNCETVADLEKIRVDVPDKLIAYYTERWRNIKSGNEQSF